jgi:cytochrome b561
MSGLAYSLSIEAQNREQAMPSTNRYTRTAISLHWLVAAAIVATFGLGLYMHELPFSPDKLRLYSWHKWAGVTIFLLVLARIVWRLAHRPPAPPASMPAWQRQAAEGVHMLLYGLMVAVPLSGWLMSSAKGVPTVWFGVLPLPDLVDKDEELGELLATVHKTFNLSMAGLVLVHAGAALKHHFVDRDEVLVRMLPFLKKP